ncbi:MAG: spiro-SPASM protein [Treponema sp.]|jgi:spiro-SPASM protein|nr:spiro-SPASM protein [Treponema sp.]
MKALNVLYGGRLGPEAFERIVPGGNNAFSLALAAMWTFPGVQKTVFLGVDGPDCPVLPDDIEAVLRPFWTRKGLLEELSLLSAGYDLVYFAWADCPLLDADLAGALVERHTRYGAEYSYADGWPYGFAPEILAPAAAGILAKLAEGDDAPVERDALFQVIQKDINAFDIETEISPVDLRPYRLSLTADSKRNLLLLSRWMEAGNNSASDAESFIAGKPDMLRTLPAFFNIQVTGACPQTCSLCPWPTYGGAESITTRKDFMPANVFGELLGRIEDFAGDAVISVSLWGEPSLHPQVDELIEMVLARPALSLVVETSGVGWKDDELRALAAAASRAAPRKNHMAPLSWIVSLDAHESERYRDIRGPGFSEARSCAKTLLSLFPNDAYVQAVRVKDFEDDIEHFYRSWKEEPEVSAARKKDGSHIIIQKYDDFAGGLPKLQASDLSPVKRRQCWHIQRDMIILLDGSVPCCREDLGALKGNGDKASWGNVFTEDLAVIWNRGEKLYLEHCMAEYRGICGHCDEYYTYNF